MDSFALPKLHCLCGLDQSPPQGSRPTDVILNCPEPHPQRLGLPTISEVDASSPAQTITAFERYTRSMGRAHIRLVLKEAVWEAAYAQKIYDGLELTTTSVTSLPSGYQNKMPLQRVMLCFVAANPVPRSPRKGCPAPGLCRELTLFAANI